MEPNNKTLWIVGGGLLLGVAMLAMRGGASAAPVMNSGPSAGAFALWAGQSHDATSLAIARLDSGTKQAVDLHSQITNVIRAGYANDLGMSQVRAGIINTRIQAATALQLDVQGNANRVTLATIGQGNVQIQANAAVKVAQTQASAAVQVQQSQTNGNIFSSIIGGIAKVASVALPFIL